MRNICKKIFEFIGILLIGCLVLVIVQLLPEDRIRYHIEQSAEQLAEEGDYYYLGSSQQAFLIDNWTEATLLMFNYTAEKQKPIYSAFIATSYMPENSTGVSRLQSIIQDEQWDQKEDLIQTRGSNWIGYNVFLRTGLCFFSLNKLRIILYIVSYVLLFLTTLCISKYSNKYKAFSFAVTMVIFNFYTLSVSWSLGIFCVYIACLAIIYFLHKQECIDYFNYMFVIGILTAYFDWLSIPLITWGLPIVIIISIKYEKNKETKIKEYISILFKTGIGWCVGYAGMIISKTAIAIMIQGKEAFDFFVKRIQADTQSGGALGYIQGVYKLVCSIIPLNLFNEGSIIPKILIVAIVIGCVYIMISHRDRRTINAIYLIVALAPFVYYLYAKGHISHVAIEFRTLMISCFSILLVFESLAEKMKLISLKKKYREIE